MIILRIVKPKPLHSDFISIESLYSIFQDHPVITTDSRNVPQGSLFFALKGDRFDGNEYALQAIEKGAAYAIVDDPDLVKKQASGNHTTNQLFEHLFLVPNALETLQQLAAYHRRHLDLPVIAITGSNGKTTTKELAHSVLSKSCNTVATEGNFNNHIGVPLTLLRITYKTKIAIVEMGANHMGEIGFLCQLAQPTHGLITNIGRAHLEGFGGFEGVVKAKTELYQYLLEHKGTIFLNTEDPLLVSLCHTANSVDYCLMSLNQPNDQHQGNRSNLVKPIGAFTGVVQPGIQPSRI